MHNCVSWIHIIFFLLPDNDGNLGVTLFLKYVYSATFQIPNFVFLISYSNCYRGGFDNSLLCCTIWGINFCQVYCMYSVFPYEFNNSVIETDPNSGCIFYPY